MDERWDQHELEIDGHKCWVMYFPKLDDDGNQVVEHSEESGQILKKYRVKVVDTEMMQCLINLPEVWMQIADILSNELFIKLLLELLKTILKNRRKKKK